MPSRVWGFGLLCSERQGAAVRFATSHSGSSSHCGNHLSATDTGPTTIPVPYLVTTLSLEDPGCPTHPERGWVPVRGTGLRSLWETSLNTTQKLKRDFILAHNLGFATSEHRDLQFSSLSVQFPVAASCSLEEIHEKEGVGEMNFVTSHISVGKQGKVSRVYFISTAQEVSVPKIALIPASTLCYFWHFCKLVWKKPSRSPSADHTSQLPAPWAFYWKWGLFLHCQVEASLDVWRYCNQLIDSSC